MPETEKAAQFRLADDVVFRVVDGEAVILSIGSGLYFGLTPVGTRIWELMETGKRLDEILGALVAEYDAPEADVKRDLDELVSKLVSRGLVAPVPVDAR